MVRKRFLVLLVIGALAMPVAPASARILDGDVAARAVQVDAKKKKKRKKAIKVTMTDFAYELSKRKVRRGTKVVFRLVNAGEELHDIFFSRLGKKSDFILAGKRGKLVITFKKKGRYDFLCTVGDHAFLGMTGTFRVT